MMARARIATGAVLVALAVPSAADAAETIGARLDFPATNFANDQPGPGGNGDGERFAHHPSLEPAYQAAGGVTADAPGVVTRFRIKF
jgi:hypothetical protein